MDGLACLDLFAGSGALGFEALSRGARRVVMVESDRKVAAGLRESAQALGAQSLEVVNADALAWLKATSERFDVAFVDPPYAAELAQASLAALRPRLNPGARVYAESSQPLALGHEWRVLREDRAGAVRYALYELSDP